MPSQIRHRNETPYSRCSLLFYSQGRSAFFLAGFTTNESENIMTHPVCRHIILLLMMCGYIGIGTVISPAVFSFINTLAYT